MNMPRKEAPKKFLDASLVPLENALLERARVIAEGILAEPEHYKFQNEKESFEQDMRVFVRSIVADEFQRLARELHHW